MNYIDKIDQAKEILSPGVSTCQGCAVEIILRRVLKIAGTNSILILPPGCSAGAGTMGSNRLMGTIIPVHVSLLDNLGALTSGISAGLQNQNREDINLIAFGGDGASADCGFQSLSGAAERGDKMLYICYDNEGYMNTGFQRSSTSSLGSGTSTTPVGEAGVGKTQQKKNIAYIMAMHNVEYVATLSPSHMNDFVYKIEKGLAASKNGFSFLYIFSPCPTGWGFPPDKTIEVARNAVKANVCPLYEVENGKWNISVANRQPISVREYAKGIKKFQHLSSAQFENWEKQINNDTAFLKLMCGM